MEPSPDGKIVFLLAHGYDYHEENFQYSSSQEFIHSVGLFVSKLFSLSNGDLHEMKGHGATAVHNNLVLQIKAFSEKQVFQLTEKSLQVQVIEKGPHVGSVAWHFDAISPMHSFMQLLKDKVMLYCSPDIALIDIA